MTINKGIQTRYSGKQLATRCPSLDPIIVGNLDHFFETQIDDGRSNTYIVELHDKKGEKIPVKCENELYYKFVRKQIIDAQGSTVRELDRQPDAAFRSERNSYDILKGTPADDWLAKLIRSDSDTRNLYLSCVPGPSYHDKLTDAYNIENQKERERLILEGLHHVGLFGGILSHQKDQFAANDSMYSPERISRRFKDYLSVIVQSKDPKIEGTDADVVLRNALKKGATGVSTDITSTLDEIISGYAELVNSLQMGHGDARTQHLVFAERKGGRPYVHNRFMLDIERIGKHPRVMDLTTFINMEAGISRPSDELLPMAIATYLASYQTGIDGYKTNGRQRRKSVYKTKAKWPQKVKNVRHHLLHRNYQQMERLAGGPEVVNTVMLELLLMDIVENTHLDATNRRMDETGRETMCAGINNWNTDDMLKGRSQQICADLDYFTENEKTIKDGVDNYAQFTAFKELLRKQARLLTALGVISYEGPLLDTYKRS